MTKMTSENRQVNTIFTTLSYICLLTCGLYFSKDAIHLYQESKTAFQTTQHQLTIDDLPSITICYEQDLNNYNGYKALRLNSSVAAKDWKIYYTFRMESVPRYGKIDYIEDSFGLQGDQYSRYGFSPASKQ